MIYCHHCILLTRPPVVLQMDRDGHPQICINVIVTDQNTHRFECGGHTGQFVLLVGFTVQLFNVMNHTQQCVVVVGSTVQLFMCRVTHNNMLLSWVHH